MYLGKHYLGYPIDQIFVNKMALFYSGYVGAVVVKTGRHVGQRKFRGFSRKGPEL